MSDVRSAVCEMARRAEQESSRVTRDRPLIIAVDFDGVLNARAYPEVGASVGGAVEAMRRLHEAGHTLIIWTCREGKDQTKAINWLLEKGIPFDGINCNAQENIERHSNDSRKVFADLYVDDRMVGGFPGWDTVLKWVAGMKD